MEPPFVMDPVMRKEWDAWQVVVAEWKTACGDINDPKFNRLVRSLRLWGENLAIMRSTQKKQNRDWALRDAQEAYDRICKT